MAERKVSLFKVTSRRKTQQGAVSKGLVVEFTKNLSILINSGVPLVKGLEVLAAQQTNEAFKKIIYNIAHEGHMGTALSLSLMRYSAVFDNWYIQMVKAGEASSSLAEVLERIAIEQERQWKLKQKIKSALTYPITVLSIAFVIVSLIITLVIPRFELIFNNVLSGKPLPWVTQFILGVSHFFLPIIAGVVGLLGLLFLLGKYLVKKNGDSLALKMPIWGKVVSKMNLASISRVLGTLLANGVPFIEALKVTEGVASNKRFVGIMQQLTLDIKSGKGFAESLGVESKLIPPMTLSMVSVGEETGRLSVMLVQIADQLEDEVQNRIEKFTSLLEPILTVLLAIVIGGIVIALFLPIIELMKNVMA